MNQDNTKLPGIPFDASKPDDLARLKAGWPLVQRDGTKFEGKFLAVNEMAGYWCKLVLAKECGLLTERSISGQHVEAKTSYDLFFASNKTRKSKWVAVVKNNMGDEIVAWRTIKSELEEFINNTSFTILSSPVELTWEEDAPLPPVETPKKGWYVGPYATEVIALANTNRTPTYGTLTEVQP